MHGTHVSALEVWHKTCQYLYLPRLKDDQVFQRAVATGIESRDFFTVAQGKDDGHYQGFVFGQHSSVIMDTSLLLITPTAAEAWHKTEPAPTPAATRVDPTATTPSPALKVEERGTYQLAATLKNRFYGSIDLDPIKAKRQFADIVDEVVQLFTSKPGIQVRIAIELEAESPAGFDESTQRAVRENCQVLKFKLGEFEQGD